MGVEFRVIDPVVHLLEAVNAARTKAEHYANFAVGAVGYCLSRKRRGLTLLRPMHEGANTKRTPNDPKHCAEMKLMEYASAHGIVYDLWLISGQPRKEDTTPTLHPCEACRAIMRTHLQKGEVLKPDTWIVCVDAGNQSICEVFTVEQLFVFHGELPLVY